MPLYGPGFHLSLRIRPTAPRPPGRACLDALGPLLENFESPPYLRGHRYAGRLVARVPLEGLGRMPNLGEVASQAPNRPLHAPARIGARPGHQTTTHRSDGSSAPGGAVAARSEATAQSLRRDQRSFTVKHRWSATMRCTASPSNRDVAA